MHSEHHQMPTGNSIQRWPSIAERTLPLPLDFMLLSLVVFNGIPIPIFIPLKFRRHAIAGMKGSTPPLFLREHVAEHH
jgi:hypothetical protein